MSENSIRIDGSHSEPPLVKGLPIIGNTFQMAKDGGPGPFFTNATESTVLFLELKSSIRLIKYWPGQKLLSLWDLEMERKNCAPRNFGSK